MNYTKGQLLHRVEQFQAELGRSLKGGEQAFHYQWVNGKARFEAEILRQQAVCFPIYGIPKVSRGASSRKV